MYPSRARTGTKPLVINIYIAPFPCQAQSALQNLHIYIYIHDVRKYTIFGKQASSPIVHKSQTHLSSCVLTDYHSYTIKNSRRKLTCTRKAYQSQQTVSFYTNGIALLTVTSLIYII